MRSRLFLFLLSGVLVAVSLPGCASVRLSDLKGLTLPQVEERADDGGFRLEVDFKYDRRSGKEVVVDQYPFACRTVRRGGTVRVQVADEEFENAVRVASTRIQVAETRIEECRRFGIETSDLEPCLAEARSIYDRAKTKGELAGVEGSATFSANTVINACYQRVEQYNKERLRR